MRENHSITLPMQRETFCDRINFIMVEGTNPSAPLSHTKEESDGDAHVVARVQQGDIDAFEFLVARHQKRMLNIAVRLLGDYDEACECVQDAFVAAFRNIGSFRGEAKFTTWLTSITLNHARNRLRQVKSRAGRTVYSLDAAVKTGDGEIRIDPPSREPSVLDRLEEQDLKARVRDCIDALHPDYREVIVMRDLQDFSYDEIGSTLGVREGTVKSRLFRAREAVKDCLKKAWGNF
jgi:RNA polymerase sigma-70 factor (ECF subfamily)